MGWAARLFSRNPCQALCLEEHKQGAHRAQDEKQHDGGAENLPLLVLPSLGMGLAGQLEMARGRPAVEKVSRKL